MATSLRENVKRVPLLVVHSVTRVPWPAASVREEVLQVVRAREGVFPTKGVFCFSAPVKTLPNYERPRRGEDRIRIEAGILVSDTVT
jgi:hypothetical protein